MKKSKVALYPGTFDPITFGHIDIIKRAAKLFDKLVVAVAKDTAKKPIFSLVKRVSMVEQEIKHLSKKDQVIEVVGFEGLLVDFAQKQQAEVIVRGLRAVSDFEYEFQMFGMNSKLDPDLQTIFLPASESSHFIASRLVKEVCRLGGDVSSFVSPVIAKELDQYFKNND